MMKSIEFIFGSLAFITSLIGLLPQIYKALKTHSTQDLSMLMLVNYAICSLAWIVYGYCTHSSFVITSNIVDFLTSALLILLKRYYDAKEATRPAPPHSF